MIKYFSKFHDFERQFSSQEELSTHLELTRAQCSLVIQGMAKKGLLKVSRQRGYLGFRLLWDKDLVNYWITYLQNSRCMHHPLIMQLLDIRSQSIGQRQHQLSIPQRILLIALMEQADEGGVVRGLGSAELVKRTGMTQTRIKSQVSRLISYQYIRSYLPGGNAIPVFGRFTSTYFLNLKHQAYAGDAKIGPTLILQVNSNVFLSEHRTTYISELARSLELLSEDKNKDLAQELMSMSIVVPLDWNASSITPPNAAAWNYLQWRLLDVASWILNGHWNELDKHFRNVIAQKPIDQVQNPRETLVISDEVLQSAEIDHSMILDEWVLALKKKRKTPEGKGLEPKEEGLLKLAFQIFIRSAVHIATGIKLVITDSAISKGAIASRCHLQVFPSLDIESNGLFATDVTLPDNGSDQFEVSGSNIGLNSTFIVGRSADNNKVIAKDISNDPRNDLLKAIGLLTPPLRNPRLRTPPRKG